MKRLYTISIDFVCEETASREIAVAIAEAAVAAGERAGGEDVTSQPYHEIPLDP